MNLKCLAVLVAILFVTGNLAQLPAPAAQDRTGDKALLDAVEKGDRQKVLALLSQGASANAKGINSTALEIAIFQQDVAMVKLLLDKGAKISQKRLRLLKGSEVASGLHLGPVDEVESLLCKGPRWWRKHGVWVPFTLIK